jgi:hypothetical protein
MKSLRISLLNIVAAAILLWLGSGILDKTIGGSTIVYTLILVILILVVDQYFRMMLGSLKRIWLVETIFLILSVLGVWIVRYIF